LADHFDGLISHHDLRKLSTFDEILGICPEVEPTNPVDGAGGAQLNKAIKCLIHPTVPNQELTLGINAVLLFYLIN